jgi:low affinity Fe/Cu permease
MSQTFNKFCGLMAQWMGNQIAFVLALLSVMLWIIAGPFSNYSDSWMLIINTVTTIVTFLMMFLLQNTGNRTIAELSEKLCRLEAQNDQILKLLEKPQHD